MITLSRASSERFAKAFAIVLSPGASVIFAALGAVADAVSESDLISVTIRSASFLTI